MEASQPKAPEDWRTPRRYRAIRKFMVPMHAKNEGVLHEPQGAAGRETAEKHCRQDAGSTLAVPSLLFEVHGPNAFGKTEGGSV